MTELQFILGSVLQSHQVSKNRTTWHHMRYQRDSTCRVTLELFVLAANIALPFEQTIFFMLQRWKSSIPTGVQWSVCFQE